MPAKAQTVIASDYVNGFLFQLAVLPVTKVDLQGLWANAPTQANDITAFSWAK